MSTLLLRDLRPLDSYPYHPVLDEPAPDTPRRPLPPRPEPPRPPEPPDPRKDWWATPARDPRRSPRRSPWRYLRAYLHHGRHRTPPGPVPLRQAMGFMVLVVTTVALACVSVLMS